VFTARRRNRPRSAGATRPLAGASSCERRLATVKQYCATCHNDRVEDGGCQLRRTDAGRHRHASRLFEKAVRKMRGRVMPPPSARQPARRTWTRWWPGSRIRSTGRHGPAYLRDNVGLHRLNRKEYANAVRDLLAVEFDATECLPADDVADGFDNIARRCRCRPPSSSST
jgi:hypothetical protein